MVKRRRAAQAAAVVLGVLVLAGCAGKVVLDQATNTAGTGGPLIDALSTAIALIPATSVAVVLAIRRPRNPIGWLLFAILILGASPTSEYDVLAYRTHPGTIPLGWASVTLEQCWPLFLASVAILLWTFPDGRLPTGRWRRPSVVYLVSGLLIATAASSSGAVGAAQHDIQVTATGDLATPAATGYVILNFAAIAMSVVAWLIWIAIQFPTYRHAHGERRQQLKWLYSGAGVTLVAFIFGIFLIPLATGGAIGNDTNPVAEAFLFLAFGALPVSMGVAVLRYRLYELDRIISRVVAYTLITGLLVAVFAGAVLLTSHVLPFQDSVSVAVSTLITAALFNPVRRRVQRVVDRRFNRARYNAEAVVAAFTARLRNNVDLDAVREDLIGVVDEAVQPTRVSMWLVPHGD
jgi:hypothetical protein